MLTFNCARLALSRGPTRSAAAILVSAVAMLAMCGAAAAAGIASGGCIGAGASLNCLVRWGEAEDPYIRHVPQPVTEEERTRAAERDRKWEQRCHPAIAQDRYGVARYEYAAPGCEFGVIQ